MTKYLLAVVAMMGLSAVGCGGNKCDDAGDRIKAKVEECGGTYKETTSEGGEEAECTDELAKQAEDAATAFEALDCEAVKLAFPAS